MSGGRTIVAVAMPRCEGIDGPAVRVLIGPPGCASPLSIFDLSRAEALALSCALDCAEGALVAVECMIAPPPERAIADEIEGDMA